MSGTTLFNTRHVSTSARRDYLCGLGSIMNIRGNTHREYDFADSPEAADAAAIGNDWIVVGEDLDCALKIYEHGRR